jgi:hypothetical protein
VTAEARADSAIAPGGRCGRGKESIVSRTVLLAGIVSFAALLCCGSAAVAQDSCKSWKQGMEGTRGWVAKLTFHRIDVTYDHEIVGNERDEKEIREGERVRLGEIECEDHSIDIEVLSEERKVKNKIRLLLSEGERGHEAIQELLEVVFERPAR